MSESPTVSDLLLGVSEIDSYGIRFEDQVITWREHVQASFDRAALLDALLDNLLGHAATSAPTRERQIRAVAEVHD